MIYEIIIVISFSATITCCILGALSKEKKVSVPKLQIAKVNWMDFTN